jgi:L-alanine-DL-glutamate epimerase-like enolase superfamily enzyme
MKITDFRAIPLRGETPEAGWSRGTDPRENLYTLIEVSTDEGLSGIGSSFTTASLVASSLDVLRPFVIGEEALEPERVTETLHQTSYWWGRGGAITTTIGGIDIALWDILSQATGLTLGQLLGGRYRDRIPAYASLLFADPPVLRERLEEAGGHGFRAVKLVWNQFGRAGPDRAKGGPG